MIFWLNGTRPSPWGDLDDAGAGRTGGKQWRGGTVTLAVAGLVRAGRVCTRRNTDKRDVRVFDTLSDRLSGIFTKLRGKGRLTDADIDATAREIRLALLEADVALPVVKGFIADVKERARGAEVSQALNPAQQIIKIVHEELIDGPRRRGAPAPVRQAAADRDHAGRPPGFR